MPIIIMGGIISGMFTPTEASAVAVGYALLGATWLVMKTEGTVAERARNQAKVLLLGVLAFMAVVSIWTPLAFERIAARWFSIPNIYFLWPVPLLTALTALMAWRWLEERREMLEEIARKRFPNVEIDVFHGLLVDYAKRKRAQAIVRGIRAVADYEYEFQMALMNRRLAPQIETVFMMPAEHYSYLSSRLVKEIAELGGSVRGLVPDIVEKRLRKRLRAT